MKMISRYHAMYDPYIKGRGISQPRFYDHMEEFGLNAVMQDMVRATSSLYNNLEINASSATKGRALMWLADYLKIDREATMALGDGGNDLSMIQAAGIGVAMVNGLEEVKAAADFITMSNDEDGVAAAVEKFVLNSKGK